jgi:hypothetical protein
VCDRTDSLGVAEARDKRRGSHLRNWFVGIVPQIVPQRVSTPDKQRHLRGHTGRHHSSAKSLEGPQKKVLRYVSTWLQRTAFQACAFNHSAISPFRINHLRILDRAESDLCPDCALTLSASPHILTGYRRSSG